MHIISKTWFRILALLATLAIAAVALVATFPEQTLGKAIALASGDVSQVQDIIDGDLPQGSTITDRAGNPIATFYEQRRTPVGYEDISPEMVHAIVAIEDRRFFEHEGVDWKSIARAAVTNARSGAVEQGGSTLTQQLVKNYLLYTATSDEQREQATSRSYTRKMREMTMASEVDKALSKEQIVTRYLNTVAFGNGAYGVEEAARTYFGISARDLNTHQSALLAGLVQAPSLHDPYVDPVAAKERRDVVLDAMAEAGFIPLADHAPELGILPSPQIPDQGCMAAGGNGFFCDYVVDYLDGLDLATGGYTITTTLDPGLQARTQESLSAHAEAGGQAAMVAAFIDPADHAVRAFASSRPYGLGEGQTTLPLVSSNVGAGAGSAFKVFTAAAALDAGLGIFNSVPVPRRVEVAGLGDSDTPECPPGRFCVENVGTYPARMSLQNALSQSPNTPFIALAEKIGNKNIVDMAVKLGLRSYAEDGTAERMAGSGSFSLGVTEVSAVEMANVGATLASGGRWCAPSPVESIVPAHPLPRPCEDVINQDLAAALGQGLSKDLVNGTAAEAGAAIGFTGAMAGKTGTTDAHQSASFMGYATGLSGFVYAFNDRGASPLCSAPLRGCDSGDLYGGMEPAQVWLESTAGWREDHTPSLPDATSSYVSGSSPLAAETVVGAHKDEAVMDLRRMGFTVRSLRPVDSDQPPGTVLAVEFVGQRAAGATVVVEVAKDAPAPVTPPPSRPAPSSPAVPAIPQVPNITSLIDQLFGF